MGKKHISIIIAIALGITLNGGAAFAQSSSIDINTAENLSIKNSFEMKSQDYSLQLAQNACDQAEDAAEDANTTLAINQQMLDLRAKPDKTPEEQAMVANYVPLTDDQIYQLIKVRDVQPLEAQYNLSVVKNNKNSIENSVKLKVYTQYISLLSDQDGVNTEQKNIEKLSNLYNASKLKLQLGVISKSDYNKTAASYKNENPVLLQKQRAMDIDEMNLNQSTGQDLHTKYSSFSMELPDSSYSIETLNYYLDSALKNRTEIVNAESYIDVKQKAYNIAEDRYPEEDNFYNKEAKYNLEEAQSNLEAIKINVQKDITNEYNILTSKKKNLDNEMQNYNSAKKAYNMADARYKAGVISKLDFETSELDYKKECDKLFSLQRELWLEQFKMDCEINSGFYSQSTSHQSNIQQ